MAVFFFNCWDGELRPFNLPKKTEWYHKPASPQAHQPSAYSQSHFSVQVLFWNLRGVGMYSKTLSHPSCPMGQPSVHKRRQEMSLASVWVSWDWSVLANTGVRMQWRSINLDVVLSSWRTLIHSSSNKAYEDLLHARLYRATRRSRQRNEK